MKSIKQLEEKSNLEVADVQQQPAGLGSPTGKVHFGSRGCRNLTLAFDRLCISILASFHLLTTCAIRVSSPLHNILQAVLCFAGVGDVATLKTYHISFQVPRVPWPTFGLGRSPITPDYA